MDGCGVLVPRQMAFEVDRASELSWDGRPMRELSRLAWPITVSMLSFSVMTLVDTYFVGRLGAASLAGVGLAGTLAWTLVCFSIGLLRAVKVLVSKGVGAGRTREARGFLAAGLMVASVLGIATLVLGELTALCVPWMAPGEAGVAGRAYLAIRMLGAPLVLLHAALREARQAEGDSRTPMVAALWANIVNIVLDYGFIVALGFGAAGAAWATVVGNAVELLLLVLVQRSIGFGRRELTRQKVRELLRIGVPVGAQLVAEMGAFAVLALVITSMGDDEMGAHQIALHVALFGFLPGIAIAEAGSVLVGQAVGAGRLALVRRVARDTMVLAAAYASVVVFVLLLAAPSIAATFTTDGSVIDKATRLLYVAAAFQLADAANAVSRGVLRGTGDVRFPAIVGIAGAWLTTVPLAWVLGHWLGLGAFGGWMGLTAEIVLVAVVLWLRIHRGGWQPAAAKQLYPVSVQPLPIS